MAEYSKKELQMLTSQASQTPQFQAPSQSLGGDIVNAIGTGLQFFQQKQAKDALAANAQFERDYEKKLSSSIMQYREMQQAFMDQKVPTAQRRLKEKRFLDSLGSQMALEVVGGTKKLTGMSGAQVDEAIEEDQLLQKEKLDRGYGYASSVLGLNQADLDSASEEQLLAWSKKSDQLNAKIEQQKAIIEVADDITAPILNIQRSVFQDSVQSQLNSIREAQMSGDTEKAIELGKQFRANVLSTSRNAPLQIKEMMDAQGKGAFYDAKLVSTYTNEVMKTLEDPTVKSVLSGKETDTLLTGSVVGKVSAAFSDKFFELSKAIANGDKKEETLTDFRNIVSYFSNKDLTGTQLFSNKAEETLLNAMGKQAPPPPPDGTAGGNTESVTNTSSSLFDYLAAPLNWLVGGSDTETVKEAQNITAEYINDKLNAEEPLSEIDVNWVMDSLTFGQNKGTEVKGRNASMQLKAPLSVLAREDYATKVKPLVDAQREQGVDVEGSLVYALNNHIQNNFKNAYRDLIEIGTSVGSLGSGSRVSIDMNRPSLAAVTGKREYSIQDKLTLTKKDGKLKFRYPKGMLGQMTDAGAISRLSSYNKTLTVINDFISSMANVTEQDKDDVALEVMFMLGRDVNVPLEEVDNL